MLLIIQLVVVLLTLPYMVSHNDHSVHFLMFHLVAPRFITVPQSAEEFIGSAVNLSCSADGFPVPDITWLFQGMNFTNETVNITNSTYTESTIVITDLMLNHGGVYSCNINSVATPLLSQSIATVAVISGTYTYTYIDFTHQHIMLLHVML